MRTSASLLMAAALLAGMTACSDSGSDSASEAEKKSGRAVARVQAPVSPLVAAGFAAPVPSGAQPVALAYDSALVPKAASVTVNLTSAGKGSTVGLSVTGLAPNHQYGAHVHVKQCGPKPTDAGPHYQDKKDPVSPSVDPAFANPKNEVWLDFTTDGSGNATSSATVEWTFRKGEANSIVLHEKHTATEHGKAGVAGARVACVTAAF